MKRQVYLSMKSLEEARNIFFSRFGPDHKTGITSVKAEESDGRITAEPVFARRSARLSDCKPTQNPVFLACCKNCWSVARAGSKQ